VDNRLLEADHCANGISSDRGNAVYIFKGADARVQDIRGDLFDPFVTAAVIGFDTGRAEFRVDFLPPGDFAVVFTCDAVLDDPGRDDRFQIEFSDGFNVRIDSQLTTQVTTQVTIH
jgi:hypothetical protein